MAKRSTVLFLAFGAVVLLLAFTLPDNLVVVVGSMFVLAAALRWGALAGTAVALWTWVIVHVAIQGAGSVSVSNFLGAGALFLTLGAGAGKAIDVLRLQEHKLRRINERMQLAMQRYQSLYEDSPIGLLTCDRCGKITAVNNRLLTIMDAGQKGELIGRNLEEFVDLTRQSSVRNIRRIFSEGSSITSEIQISTLSGRPLWIRFKANPVLDGDGKTKEVMISVEDISDMKEAQRRVSYLSFHDSLTGLHNRAYFEEELKRVDNAVNLPLSIIMGDVNGLKLVNDTFGHATGDEYLKRIADILAGCCRRDDVVARWAGDEFAILLPYTDEETADQVCERIRRACQQSPKCPVVPSIALGAATKLESSVEVDEILRQAEQRMYRNKLSESISPRSSTVVSLISSLRARSLETEEHTARVQHLAEKLGRALGLRRSELDKLSLLAVFHDVGEVAVPYDILNKPGPLTKAEWQEVKRHPEVGYRIARLSSDLTSIAEAIFAHHEWWDGTGYPRRLKGKKIPLLSRILAVADAYEVMTSGRPYKPPVSSAEALAELRRGAGAQFDPQLVQLLVQVLERESNTPN